MLFCFVLTVYLKLDFLPDELDTDTVAKLTWVLLQ